MKTKVNITFLGAAGTVTGSKFLLEIEGLKILVDCGMFQGLKELRLLNWKKLPINESEVDYVLLTHGHMDHVGYLPKLVKSGFSGQILGTKPTLSIASIVLRDSAKIQEEDAARANKEGYSIHEPAEPLYDLIDTEKSLKLFNYVDEGEWIQLSDKLKVRFNYVGHILGATYIELDYNGKIISFSGDVGRNDDFILFPPKKINSTDVLLIESTYGDRIHPIESVEDRLITIINETVKKKGTLIIPSFAVERAQTLMLLLWRLREQGKIPFIPLVLDSPMGNNVLDLFIEFHQWHKLSMQDAIKMKSSFEIIEDYKETWDVINKKTSKVIIAGSGMVSGGRVLTYLKNYINHPENTVLISGFQAKGTRGRALVEGTHEIKIFGKYYTVKAKIEELRSLSGHADQKELLEWMGQLKSKPSNVFIVHGEKQAADSFRVKLKTVMGIDAVIPKMDEKIVLNFN